MAAVGNRRSFICNQKVKYWLQNIRKKFIFHTHRFLANFTFCLFKTKFFLQLREKGEKHHLYYLALRARFYCSLEGDLINYGRIFPSLLLLWKIENCIMISVSSLARIITRYSLVHGIVGKVSLLLNKKHWFDIFEFCLLHSIGTNLCFSFLILQSPFKW